MIIKKIFIIFFLLVFALTLSSCKYLVPKEQREFIEPKESYDLRFKDLEINNYFQKGLEAERNGELTRAEEFYKKAHERVMSVPKENITKTTRNPINFALQRIKNIRESYPYSKEEFINELLKNIDNFRIEELNEWEQKGVVNYQIFDGEKKYSNEAILDLCLKSEIKERCKLLKEIFSIKGYSFKNYLEYIKNDEKENQKVYIVNWTIVIDSSNIQQGEVIKIWIPIPILRNFQQKVKITSVIPENSIKFPPVIEGDNGILYLEVLSENTLNQKISVELEFERYSIISQINTDNIGDYIKDTSFYKKYTDSQRYIEITDDIENLANEIVGEEKNHYFKSKKIYDWFINNIQYRITPYEIIERDSVSEFVHKNKYGDELSQAVYFTALNRAVGIPSRIVKGWTITPDYKFLSPHIWSEIYLENYGWIPIDPALVSEIYSIAEFSDGDKESLKEFYFGNLDNFRFEIGNDDLIGYLTPEKEYERTLEYKRELYRFLQYPQVETNERNLVGMEDFMVDIKINLR